MFRLSSSIIILILSVTTTTTVYAEIVTTRGEYLYGPETSEASACRLAEERAKSAALSKVLGENISIEEHMSCRDISGNKSDHRCELNNIAWSTIEGDIKSITDYQKVIEIRSGERACIVTLSADVVIPNRKPDPNFDVKAILNEKIFRVGEELTMKFEPTVPMHIVVFNWVPYQDKNSVVRMFPNSLDPQGHIKEKTSIPTENRLSNYNFTTTWPDELLKDKTFIDEYLIIIATKKPIKWLSKYELADFKETLRKIPANEKRVVKQGYQLIHSSKLTQ